MERHNSLYQAWVDLAIRLRGSLHTSKRRRLLNADITSRFCVPKTQQNTRTHGSQSDRPCSFIQRSCSSKFLQLSWMGRQRQEAGVCRGYAPILSLPEYVHVIMQHFPCEQNHCSRGPFPGKQRPISCDTGSGKVHCPTNLIRPADLIKGSSQVSSSHFTYE